MLCWTVLNILYNLHQLVFNLGGTTQWSYTKVSSTDLKNKIPSLTLGSNWVKMCDSAVTQSLNVY